MSTHQLPRHQQWCRDHLGDVPRWVFGLVVLTVFSALIAVLGVGLLVGGSRAGVFVLLGGAVTVAAVVAYWSGGQINGGTSGKPQRIQAAGRLEYVPERVDTLTPRGLLGLPPADGVQAQGGSQPGADSVVRPLGRHRVVHRVPVAPVAYWIIGTVPEPAGATSAEATGPAGSGDVAAVA